MTINNLQSTIRTLERQSDSIRQDLSYNPKNRKARKLLEYIQEIIGEHAIVLHHLNQKVK